jgi:hypothetical protein
VKKENWKDYMTAGSLSWWILWNRPTLNESIKEYMRKIKLINIKGYFCNFCECCEKVRIILQIVARYIWDLGGDGSFWRV